MNKEATLRHKLVHTQTKNEHWIDESVSLEEMEKNLKLFFKTKHGKRETYHVHRGCLIVRNTVTFTGCKPQRLTAIYTYSPDEKDTHNIVCKPEPQSVRQAMRFIDNLIARGEYEYGVDLSCKDKENAEDSSSVR